MFQKVDPRPNFPEMEKKTLKWWYESGVVEKYLHRNDKSPKRFSFLDGPITANNPMGVHHAWGRTFKDLWQRFYNLRGYKERFQNGFDCQGLWVEVEVEKELGFRSKKEIETYGVANFVNRCKERVLKYSSIQTEQSKRLGYFMDWDNSYFTMSDENNYMIWYFLKECFKRGWIYKGHESIPWCPRCETAISQHEILTEDYKEITHDSIIMKFPLVDRTGEFLLVWTTTPWTIIANIAVAVDKDADYSLVSEENDAKNKYWVASALADRIFTGRNYKVQKTIKGKEMAGWSYKSAFDGIEAVEKARSENPEQFHTVVVTDPLLLPVSMEEGTGMVHTAVSAGEEDFKLGKKLGLPMIPVITDNADYLPGLEEFTGQNAKKNPKLILDYMEKREKEEGLWVFKIFPYKHRYPACWRCKTELVWKVADEWYIAMDRKPISNIKYQISNTQIKNKKETNTKTLREMMIEVVKKIKWLPEFGLERELDWLKNMHDWLISKKNRYWGLALPIYECKKCGRFEIIGSERELEERAVEGWEKFKGHTPHKPWIDEVKIKCAACGTIVSRTPDVGNPWLDAGIVSFSTLLDPVTEKLSYTTDKKYWEKWFPADFITESFPGQFKNWFYSLIVMGTVLEYTNPFKTVLGFGTLLGEDGRPMHKSWGNAIEFNEGADKIGVDVMRWMYATHKPEDNLLFGYKTADETRRKFHLLLWNIYNFFVTYANIDGWESEKDQISNIKDQKYILNIKNVLDDWILLKLNILISTVTKSLEKYDAYAASLEIEKFVSDLSVWYVRRCRDRVGPTIGNSADKEMCYYALFQVLVTLVKLIAPFNPFMAEEIYKNLTGEESVHLVEWPDKNSIPIKSGQKSKLLEEMEFVRHVCELGHAIRKKEGIKVRQPLKQLKIQNAKFKIENELIRLVRDELNIKEVEVRTGKGELEVKLDTILTDELKEEGKAREIIRSVQLQRKELGYTLTQRIKVYIPDWPKSYEDYIKKETLASSILKKEIFGIEKV